MKNEDEELAVIQTIMSALNSLDDELSRIRAFDYVSSRLKTDTVFKKESHGTERNNGSDGTVSGKDITSGFSTFADFYNSANPSMQTDKALLAGYWIQKSSGEGNFDSRSVNVELKNLGYGVSNTSSAVTSLTKKKPTLVIQIGKTGKGTRARKVFKVTSAGEEKIREMLSLSVSSELSALKDDSSGGGGVA